ncbi:MAG: LysR family transcriptional regulator [Bdellovibrionales bacterium]|nr:LysR family transcriptional regulator [Bdellovibrionales bacterium]
MSINSFDLNLLKTFVAVADSGSFTKAAQKLFIEQPSVSRAIQRLEEDVGTLFLRTKRRVQLTTKGTDLLILAKNILSASDDFLNVARNQEGELSGTIKFGAASPISSLFMPDVIQRISDEYPQVWTMMYTGVTDDIIRRIKFGELEFGLFLYEGNHVTGLDYKELVQCKFSIVASPQIDREGQNSFVGSREVNESDTALLPTFGRLKRLNKSLRIKYSTNDLNAYRELLLRGLGIGLLPEVMIRNDLKQKKLKLLYPEIELNFPIWFVNRRGHPVSLEAKRIVALLEKVVTKR